jgi:hypothetical protein
VFRFIQFSISSTVCTFITQLAKHNVWILNRNDLLFFDKKNHESLKESLKITKFKTSFKEKENILTTLFKSLGALNIIIV